MSRCSRFNVQPPPTKSSASQSSSSGCVGAAEGAEVGRGLDQPSAEVVHPDPVDQDSRDKRMLAAGQMDGIGQPTAGRREAPGRRPGSTGRPSQRPVP